MEGIEELVALGYAEPETVFDQIYDVISHYPSFSVHQFSFKQSGKGPNLALICLSGLLPTQSARPLSINVAIPLKFPHKRAEVFLVPTPGSEHIPNHPNVDHKGRAVLSSLKSGEESKLSLTELLQSLSEVFSSTFPFRDKEGSCIEKANQETSPPEGRAEAHASEVHNTALQLFSKLQDRLQSQQRIGEVLSRKEVALQRAAALVLQKRREVDEACVVLDTAQLALDTWEGSQLHDSLDDCVQPTKHRGKILVELTAENQAIQDTMFYVNQALETKAISFEEWSHTLRRLGREQYAVRATILRILELD